MNKRAAGAIVVMGVSGSGKSTLGCILARRLGGTFLEGDDFHAPASVAKMRAGEPLDDADRWPWLDRLGEAMAAEIARGQGVVTACSALKRSYRDRLARAIGKEPGFVLLDAGRAELVRRLTGRADHYMPVGLLDSQIATLQRPLADECAIILDAVAAPSVLADAAVAWIGRAAAPASP